MTKISQDINYHFSLFPKSFNRTMADDIAEEEKRKGICKNCGHSIETFDNGISYHKGVTKKGTSYRQKLCWQDNCECLNPQPKGGEK